MVWLNCYAKFTVLKKLAFPAKIYYNKFSSCITASCSIQNLMKISGISPYYSNFQIPFTP